MSADFAKGAAVRQVMPAPVRGTVQSFRVDEESGALIYVILDTEGNERTFRADQIESDEA